MIRQLLTRLASRSEMDVPSAQAQPFAHASTPEGMRLIAVGDIHGRLDLLQALLRQLEDWCAANPGPETRLIFLGDYIDRGSLSAEVLECLVTLSPPWASVHYLRGNHEQCFLDVLEGVAPAETVAAWLDYGGMETLSSYGLGTPLLYSGDMDAILAAARAAVPAHHRQFLANTGISLRLGDYLFVHAGVRPGVPLAAQQNEDLIWIREPFLSSTEDLGAVVVHGHTIVPEPQSLPNRIAVDTGAWRSGVLTAVILEGRSRRFLSTGPQRPA